MAVTKPPPAHCPTCDAKLVEYKHSLNEPLARALMKLYRVGGSAHINDLKLTYSQQCNFQKLRYFGLVEVPTRTGVWEITDKGRQFCEGKVDSRQQVWTFRGEVERWDGNRIHIWEVTGGYQQWQQWAAEAVAHP